MRRADRLFQIVEYLRHRKRAVTARQIAETLAVSERTIYRDIADLCASGVPIDGAAGVGYRLPPGAIDLPPLMFTSEELEALVLGSRMVQAWGDVALANSVEQAVSKIEAVISPKLKQRLQNTPLFAVNPTPANPVLAAMLTHCRTVIGARQKALLSYRAGDGSDSQRVVWPLGLFYWAPSWTLGAYCELRADFRNFRVDRISALDETGQTFPSMPGRTVEDLIAAYSDGE